MTRSADIAKSQPKSGGNSAEQPDAQEDENAEPPEKGDKQRAVFDWLGEHKDDKAHQTISSLEVATGYGIPHKHLSRYLKNEILEAEACKSLPFTLLLVISYSIMAIAHDDAITIRAVEDSLEFDIRENANFAFTGPMGHKGIDDVNTADDFYKWMKLGLVPLIFQQEPSFHEGYLEEDLRFQALKVPYEPKDRGFWLNYNRIVGGMRLVQERTEEKECTTESSLHKIYGLSCVGGHDYDLDPEVGLPNERAQTTIDPTYETWMYIYDDLDQVLKEVDQLQAGGWLDRETQKIEIGIPIYNAEFGVHTLVRVNFYFSRGGHIWKNVIPQSQFADWHDRWYYGVYDAIWLLCLTYILVVEVIEVQGIIRGKGILALFTEYLNFYNFVDWLTVLGGFAIIATFLSSIGMRTEMNAFLKELGGLDFFTNREVYTEVVRSYFQSLQDNVNYVRNLRYSLSVYPLIIVFRLFKSFSAQPRLALVTKTMFRAGPDLFHFLIVFGSVFLTFTICGIVLFGREVRSFTTVSRAMVSCFRIMLGDINWTELSAVGRAPAGVWLWLFIIIVVLLMLNMVLAIIMDNYEEVKEQSGAGETLWQEGLQLWRRWRDDSHVPLEHVLDAVNNEARRIRLKRNPKNGQMSKLFGAFANFAATPEHQQTGSGDLTDAADSSALHKMDSKASLKTGTTQGDISSNHAETEGNIIITIDSLKQAMSRSNSKFTRMSQQQAEEVLVGAVDEFYEHHKKRAELDELLLLAQKVNARVRKLTKLTRQAQEVRDSEPVRELMEFAENVEKYLEQITQERNANMQEKADLEEQKASLEERLQRFAPDMVFQSALGSSAPAGNSADPSTHSRSNLRNWLEQMYLEQKKADDKGDTRVVDLYDNDG